MKAGMKIQDRPSPTGRGWREAPGEGFAGPVDPSSGPWGVLLPVGEGHPRVLPLFPREGTA